MKQLVVANWKMHMDPHQASLFVHRLQPKLTKIEAVEVVICPPTLDLYSLARDIDKSKLSLGAQDLHYADEGAHTGETSPAMLKGLVKYALVGHSERRQAGEDDKVIAKKVAAALRNDIVPIICVGETLEQREHDLSFKVVHDQITAALHDVTAADMTSIVVAYEPLWAISDGTRHAATPNIVAPVILKMREILEDLYGEEGGTGVRFLYGGSVDAENAAAFMKIEDVCGLLIGGASLNYESFNAIIHAAA